MVREERIGINRGLPTMDDSLLQSFATIKPAAEKILSDRTDVDGTAKYRRARTESLEYLSELSFHHTRESVSGSALSRIKTVISDSTLSSESSSKRKSSTRCTFAFFGELSFSLDLRFNIVKGSSSNTLLIVQYFKFELCSYQFNHFVWLTLLNLQASVLPGE
jgi:hypothetical protein